MYEKILKVVEENIGKQTKYKFKVEGVDNVIDFLIGDTMVKKIINTFGEEANKIFVETLFTNIVFPVEIQEEIVENKQEEVVEENQDVKEKEEIILSLEEKINKYVTEFSIVI